MATWYQRSNRPPSRPAPRPQQAAPALARTSWTGLRLSLARSDELQAAWLETAGSSLAAQDEPVVARPNRQPVAGTLLDDQFIAMRRTLAVIGSCAPPAPARHDLPLRHLQQLSLASRYLVQRASA